MTRSAIAVRAVYLTRSAGVRAHERGSAGFGEEARSAAPQGGGRDAAGGNEVPRRRCPGRVGRHRWRGWPEAIGPAVLRPRRRSGGTVIEEVAALAASPLVTPTGLGGSRKTRLATQCQAVEIYDAFARRWPMLQQMRFCAPPTGWAEGSVPLQNGGSARGYQELFVPLAARQSRLSRLGRQPARLYIYASPRLG
jgi:hypothetical protein